MFWRVLGSALGWLGGVGGWVASLVLALVGCGRSYLPVSARFWAGLVVFGWVVFAARGGCVLWSVFRAVPCSAPMGGFPLHTAGAAFLVVSGGLSFR